MQAHTEVVRMTVVELEQVPGSVLQHHSWWLFFACEGQKTRAKKNGVWHEVLTVSAAQKSVLVLSLFAWGRIKHELVGSVELSLENIKTLVLAGEETNALQRQCDFWFDCKAAQTTVASVRLAFELSLTPQALKERMREMLRPLLGVPVSQELVSFAAMAHRAAAEDSADEGEEDGSENCAEGVAGIAPPVSSKLYMAYESAYGSYGGAAERGYVAKEMFSYQKIADLSISFVKQAEHFAKTIVMERFLAIKTVRPIASMGVLGERLGLVVFCCC